MNHNNFNQFNQFKRNRSYSPETKSDILFLHKQGLSSRRIADDLGVSKSGVNDFLASLGISPKKSNSKQQQGPKVLFIDLETSAALAYCFGRHKVFLQQDNIKTEGGKLLCAGYRWEGQSRSTVLKDYSEVKQQEDYLLCQLMHNLYSKADVVVGHNILGFDHKMLEVRCLANGLPPLPAVKLIDTLQIAKQKFRFPSNKLDALAAYLGIGRKVSHSGIDLWIKTQEGSKEALDDMVEYCKQDVDLLYDVFMHLRGRGLVSGINYANYYNDTVTRCKSCGSKHLIPTGRLVTTPTGRYNELQCQDCEALQRDKKNQLSKEKRSSLTAAV